MASEQWDDRDILRSFYGELREDAPEGTPLKTIATGVVASINKRLANGNRSPIEEAWVRTARERDIEAVYQDMRRMEKVRGQIFTKAEDSPDAPVVRLAGTQGLRNPDTRMHERPVTRSLGFKQFEQYRARQLRLFATEVEKQKWIDRVYEFWKANQDIPDLEAVCEAAGIPFEPAYAAEMA